MAEKKHEDGFFQQAQKFFKRVQNQDILRMGGKGGINIFNSPQSQEEFKTKQQLNVFRQYLNQKNWNLKHLELFDEYRKMDKTFPIINAALRLYAQEVCLTGDNIITIGGGIDITIKEQYDKQKNFFLVKTVNTSYPKVKSWAECHGIKSNGVKDVYEVIVQRSIDEETAEWDKKTEAKFKCTNNHKILLNDGKTYKELKDLKVGDLIYAIYDFLDPNCKCKEQIRAQSMILSIKHVGQEEVFDLINVSPYHHFTLKLTDSFSVVVHNCNKDGEGNIFTIKTEERDVKTALEQCFYDNLKLDSKSYLLVKSMLKFGNSYGFLNTRRGVGVTDIIPLPPEAIRIHLLDSSEDFSEFKYHWYGQGGNMQFDPWEVVHWKVLEDLETEPYGESILRSVVDTYRRIILMREALIIYRITRAPQRYLYKIDTSGMDPDAALRYAQQMKQELYKKPLVDPRTGEIDMKYNPVSIEENIYMPTFEGDVGGVDILEGASNLDAVEDYKVIKDDLFAGLLIPKSFLTFEESLSNKNALCLRENTEVSTTEGKITIKEISNLFKENPKYKLHTLSCNEKGYVTAGKVLWCKPTKLVKELNRITLSNGGIVECTDNHPFLLETLVYKNASLLQEGDKIKNIFDKEITIVKNEIFTLEIEEEVYDLEVEEHHNFALGSGIFVHNSMEDLRFSNAVSQYQTYFIDGLLHIGLVHLYLNGFSKDDLEGFEIQMNSSSTAAELNKIEILSKRIELAKSALDTSNGNLTIMSVTRVMKEILKFTDEEIAQTFKDQLSEKRLAWRLSQLNDNGFYEEPDLEKRRAKMKELGGGDDVFKGLRFESENMEVVEKILKDKVDKEINSLLKGNKLKPNKKQIEKVISLNEHKMKSNIKKTFIDLGMKG